MYIKAQRDFREVPTAYKARIVHVHGGGGSEMAREEVSKTGRGLFKKKTRNKNMLRGLHCQVIKTDSKSNIYQEPTTHQAMSKLPAWDTATSKSHKTSVLPSSRGQPGQGGHAHTEVLLSVW